MSKLNKLKLSGTTYELQDLSAQPLLSAGTGIQISGNVISCTGGGGGNPTVELTQAEYDALVSGGTVNPDVFYIITDATPINIDNYWTSAQTQSAITEAVSGKVDSSSVVTAVTSASTDSQIPTAKAVFDAIPSGATYSAGTGINITDNVISCTKSETKGLTLDNASKPRKLVQFRLQSENWSTTYATASLGLGSNLVYGAEGGQTLSVSGALETSAITTSITSGSTDAQVPSAKAVYDAIAGIDLSEIEDRLAEDEEVTAAALNALNDNMGGLKFQQITQAAYDALVSGGTVDSSTLYVITSN